MLLTIHMPDDFVDRSPEGDATRKSLIEDIKNFGFRYGQDFVVSNHEVKAKDLCSVDEHRWSENGDIEYLKNFHVTIFVYYNQDRISQDIKDVISRWVESNNHWKTELIFIPSEIYNF